MAASSGDRREDQAAASGAAAGALFAAIEAAILAALADLVRRAVLGSLAQAVAARRLVQTVTAIFARARPQIRAIIGGTAAAARADAEQVIRGDLGQLPGELAGRIAAQVTREAVLPGLEEALDRAEQTVARAASEAFMRAVSTPPAESLLRASLDPLRTQDDVYREVVREAMRYRSGIGEAVRGLAGAERRAASLSRLETAQKVIDDLAARGITGFTDAAGRRWELASYAEMATRTASSRLHLQLQLAAMGPAGMDLVIVDNPSRVAPCPICRRFEGRLLSLTGRSTGQSTIRDADGSRRTKKVYATLAEATAAGLFHPSCRHSLVPWVDGAAMLPTAGGQQRGYVDHGQPVSSPLPIGTLQDYRDEQKLRAMERRVRAARRVHAAAMTTAARRDARRDVSLAVARIEDHVSRTGVLRQPRREKLGAR